MQLDDALSATKLQDGRIKILIHVADPTIYVQPGSIVDRYVADVQSDLLLNVWHHVFTYYSSWHAGRL